MKTNNVADTTARSPERARSRRLRAAHAGLFAIVTAGIAVVQSSRAAPIGSTTASKSAPLGVSTRTPSVALPASTNDASAADAALRTLEQTCASADAVACNDLGVSHLNGY